MAILANDSIEYQATYAEEAAMLEASELIAEALEISGMTRTELAQALNVPKSEITARLKGKGISRSVSWHVPCTPWVRS